MWNSLIDTGDAGVQILQAYTVKEDLRSLLDLAGTNPERHVVRTRLDNFYRQAAAIDAPEVHRLAATVEAWWPAIEAGLLTGYSNSRSEGYTRLAKRQGRNGCVNLKWPQADGANSSEQRNTGGCWRS